jgi:hypothetical protein
MWINVEPMPPEVARAVSCTGATYIWWFDKDTIEKKVAWQEALEPFRNLPRQPLKQGHIKTHYIWYATHESLHRCGAVEE